MNPKKTKAFSKRPRRVQRRLDSVVRAAFRFASFHLGDRDVWGKRANAIFRYTETHYPRIYRQMRNAGW